MIPSIVNFAKLYQFTKRKPLPSEVHHWEAYIEAARRQAAASVTDTNGKRVQISGLQPPESLELPVVKEPLTSPSFERSLIAPFELFTEELCYFAAHLGGLNDRKLCFHPYNYWDGCGYDAVRLFYNFPSVDILHAESPKVIWFSCKPDEPMTFENIVDLACNTPSLYIPDGDCAQIFFEEDSGESYLCEVRTLGEHTWVSVRQCANYHPSGLRYICADAERCAKYLQSYTVYNTYNSEDSSLEICREYKLYPEESRILDSFGREICKLSCLPEVNVRNFYACDYSIHLLPLACIARFFEVLVQNQPRLNWNLEIRIEYRFGERNYYNGFVFAECFGHEPNSLWISNPLLLECAIVRNNRTMLDFFFKRHDQYLPVLNTDTNRRSKAYENRFKSVESSWQLLFNTK